MAPAREIDILESTLRRRGNLLNILLSDKTTGKNILWATDSYESMGEDYKSTSEIRKELITGKYERLIQPRAAKPLEEQKQRTKDKGEVFTPLKIIDRMNKLVDWSSELKIATPENWRAYVSKTMLEISCGEAPFIVSRYNPTASTGKLIVLANRVGFLDRKLRVVSQYCNTTREWLKWARVAYKASYGYEWQGDNLLIARENLLYTLIDYYKDKFDKQPSLATLRDFAEIISWNIFQMDGLKYVIPMSCKPSPAITPRQLAIFDGISDGGMPSLDLKYECDGCVTENKDAHTGVYVNIMDWIKNERIAFVDLVKPRAVADYNAKSL